MNAKLKIRGTSDALAEAGLRAIPSKAADAARLCA